MKKHIRMNITAVLVAAVAFSALVGSHTYAQAANTNANVLKVSPVRSDVEVKPGESKDVRTTVTNLTNSPITVRSVENDFIASNKEDGSPALILDENKFAPTHSLKRFMKPIGDVTIPAKGSKDIMVTITPPLQAQAGGYFGAVRFVPVTANGDAQVNLNASAASLILLSVPGNVVEKLDMTKFEIQQDGKAGSFFQSSNDLQAAVRFENKGGAQEGPFGKVTVTQNGSVVYEADFNNDTPRQVILPDSARAWDIPLKKIGSFGNYTVTATFSYGKKNQTIEVTKSFWVVPQIVIIATIVGVLVLVLFVIAIVLLVRNNKRHGLKHRGFRH
ncbi:MAG: hypothetical protein JWP06_1019 [Candidatus Saccharibacteria bacterium]|nr:hypothetical protein [Candidatus Saccharibacteria bacterium]